MPSFVEHNGQIIPFQTQGQADAFVQQETLKAQQAQEIQAAQPSTLPPSPGMPAMPMPSTEEPVYNDQGEVRMRKGDDFRVFTPEEVNGAKQAGYVYTTDADIQAQQEQKEGAYPYGDSFAGKVAAKALTAGEGIVRGTLSVPAAGYSLATGDTDVTGGSLYAGLSAALDGGNKEEIEAGIRIRAKTHKYAGLAGEVVPWIMGGAAVAKGAAGVGAAAQGATQGSKMAMLARAIPTSTTGQAAAMTAIGAAEGVAGAAAGYNEDRWIEDRAFSADQMYASMTMPAIIGGVLPGAGVVIGRAAIPAMKGYLKKGAEAAGDVVKKGRQAVDDAPGAMKGTEAIFTDELGTFGISAEYIRKRGGTRAERLQSTGEDLAAMHRMEFADGTKVVQTPSSVAGKLTAAATGDYVRDQAARTVRALEENRAALSAIAGKGQTTIEEFEGVLRNMRFADMVDTPVVPGSQKAFDDLVDGLWRLDPKTHVARKAGRAKSPGGKTPVSGEQLWAEKEKYIRTLTHGSAGEKAAGARAAEAFEELMMTVLGPADRSAFEMALTDNRTLRRFAGAAETSLYGHGGVSPFLEYVKGMLVTPVHPLGAAAMKMRAGQGMVGNMRAMVGREQRAAKLIAGEEVSRAGMGAAVTSMFKGGARGFTTRALPMAKMLGGALSPEAISGVIPAASVAFAKGHASNADAYQDRLKELAEAGNNLEGMTNVINGHMGDDGDLSPMLTMDINAHHMNNLKYLTQAIPRGAHAGGSALTPDAPRHPPAPGDVESFARKWEAAADPWGVVDSVGNGTATKEGMETLQALFPEFHKELQMRTMEVLGSMKTRLPMKQAMQVERVLGMPGALVAANQPDFQIRYAQVAMKATLETAAAEGGAPTGGNGKPGRNPGNPTFAQQMKSPSVSAHENIHN